MNILLFNECFNYSEFCFQKADLAIADLTITYQRESVVDFTMPFMSLGIGILFKREKKDPPGLFSFTLPFAPQVWFYLVASFLGVTLFLFFIARICPYEWYNKYFCTEEPSQLKNNFPIENALWFTIGSIIPRGCDIMPRSLSTRILAASWWFFILVIISAFKANLIGFLFVGRTISPIKSVEDLVKQDKIPYGCLESGSTQAFFKNSNFSTYARMWSFMESHVPSVFVESSAEGKPKFQFK